jgi:hypothetical protein
VVDLAGLSLVESPRISALVLARQPFDVGGALVELGIAPLPDGCEPPSIQVEGSPNRLSCAALVNAPVAGQRRHDG